MKNGSISFYISVLSALVAVPCLAVDEAQYPLDVALSVAGSGTAVSPARAVYLSHLNRTLHTLKTTDPESGASRIWTWDEQGEILQDNGQQLRRDEAQARHTDVGALSDALLATYESLEPGAVYPVLIWLPTYEASRDKSADLDDMQVVALVDARSLRNHEATNALLDAAPWLAALAAPVETAPAVVAELTFEEASLLAQLPQVAELLPFKRGKAHSSTSYVDTIGASYAMSGLTGSGVKVCAIEGYKPTSQYTGSVTTLWQLYSQDDFHARCDAAMINSGQSPGGSSPSASLLWASWTGTTETLETATSWCVNQAARVWNVGFEVDAGQARLYDYYVKQYPYPLYVASVGQDVSTISCSTNCSNTPNTYSVKPYGGLVVAGSCDLEDSTRSNDRMYCNSQTRNPSSANGDLEFPHVVAPANNLSADGITCGTGTSWAAALTAGGVAQLVQLNSSLGGWPEALRAIMMVGADNTVDGSTLSLTTTVDDRDGAGEINIVTAGRVADSSQKMNGGNSASEYGHDYGEMTSTGTPLNSFYSEVYHAYTASSGKRLRVVLTWDSTATCTSASDATTCSSDSQDADLDLKIYDNGVLVGSSVSYDNTFEFVEIDATATHTYDIKIQNVGWTASATYFALAWRVGTYTVN